MNRQALAKAMRAMTESLTQAHIHIPREDLDYSLEYGLRNLLKRRLVIEASDEFSVAPEAQPVLQYYANSIGQLFRSRGTEG